MPAWITSLLRALTPVAMRPSRSRTSVSWPRSAHSRASARPTTPAPTMTVSMRSMRSLEEPAKCSRPRWLRQCGYNARSLPQGERAVAVVNYRIERGIAVVTLDNPPVNALSLAVREGLAAALAAAAQDPAVAAILITGSARAFSAGADLREIETGESLKAPLATDLQHLMEASAKPVVAAIEGLAPSSGCPR